VQQRAVLVDDLPAGVDQPGQRLTWVAAQIDGAQGVIGLGDRAGEHRVDQLGAGAEVPVQVTLPTPACLAMSAMLASGSRMRQVSAASRIAAMLRWASARFSRAVRLLVEDGILLRKYWFSVSDAEQQRRFRSRLADPMRRWKLSPMDLESITRWEDYSRAKDEMFVHTDIPEAPWYVVESEDKRRARINMIAHLLSTVPYHEVQRPPLELPPRPPSKGYERPPREMQTAVPDHAATLI
jgi:hypothetical protein